MPPEGELIKVAGDKSMPEVRIYIASFFREVVGVLDRTRPTARISFRYADIMRVGIGEEKIVALRKRFSSFVCSAL